MSNSKLNIAVLISGGGTNLQSLIDNTKNGNINGEIKLVISNKKDAYGLVRAKNSGIEAIFIDPKSLSNEMYDKAILNEFKDKNIDLIVLAGYLKIITKELILKFPNKIINIHPSLIPSFSGPGYYGIKVHEAAINYGVKYSGATVHLVSEAVDGGPILLQDIVKITPSDDAGSLQLKILEKEHKLLVEAVKLFCAGKFDINERIVTIKGVN